MHAEFAKEMRAAYLEVARDMVVASGRPPTETRLRLMTGMATADIASTTRPLTGKEDDLEGPVEPHTLASSVLSAWHTEPSYTFAYGIPTELPASAPPGQPSVAALVSNLDATADVDAVIEQLLDARCIREVGNPKRYAVISRVYMPSSLSGEAIRYFAEASERFISTIEHNLIAEDRGERLMERAVFADRGIPEHLLPEFKAFVKDQWSRFADPIDEYMNSPVGPANESGPVVHTGVGVYHYVSVAPDETSSENNQGDRKGS